MSKTHETTEEFAEALGVVAQSVRASYCRYSHYMGIQPVKLPNRRLLWPVEARERLLRGEVGKAVATEPLAA